MSTCFFYSVLALVFLVSFLEHHHLCGADPTDGFIPVPLTEDNYKLQKPYDIPLEDRYSYKDGVRRFWVYNKDKPFKPDTTTRPRTEIRISVFSLSLSLSLDAYGFSFLTRTLFYRDMTTHQEYGNWKATLLCPVGPPASQ
jgi:hypothetical protein